MKIRTGKEIRNEQDIHNLVISIILRQTEKYQKTDIINYLKHCLKGSEFYKNDILQKEIIEDNLNFLQRRDMIFCMDGVYTPGKII